MSALYTPLGGLPKVELLAEEAVVVVGTANGFATSTLPTLRARLLLAVHGRLDTLEQSAAKWTIVNQNTVMAAGKRYLADARNGSFDVSFPETVEGGQPFEITVVGGSVHLQEGDYDLIGVTVPIPLTSGTVFKFVALNPTTIVFIP